MTQEIAELDIPVDVPSYGIISGKSPIVILGPNGSGKTKLARAMAMKGGDKVVAISAQRRTWLDDHLPVQESTRLLRQVRSHEKGWQNRPYQQTDEINYVVSSMVQAHSARLSNSNENAIEKENTTIAVIRDTNLIKLQTVWRKLFPNRKLQISDFFPKVKRLDNLVPTEYPIKEMSDL